MSEGGKQTSHQSSSHPKHSLSPSKNGGNGHAHHKKQSHRKGAEPWYRRPVLVGAIMAGVIALTVGGVLWWFHSRHYEYTDDAYVDMQSEHVSPRVAGRVLHVNVDDNQDVTAGEVLVELDPADFQAKLDEALAAETQAKSQASQAEAEVASSDARVEEAKKNAAAAQATADNADALLRRYEALKKLNPGAVAQQQMDRATADAKSSSAQLDAARQGVTAAEAGQRSAASGVKNATATIRRASALVDRLPRPRA